MPRQLFSALLKVHVGILLSADASNPAVPMLPDLLWALWPSFTLRAKHVRTRGASFNWFESDFTNRSFSEMIGGLL